MSNLADEVISELTLVRMRLVEDYEANELQSAGRLVAVAFMMLTKRRQASDALAKFLDAVAKQDEGAT